MKFYETAIFSKLYKIIPKRIVYYSQWRSEAKCRPGPTIKLPPFPPLKFAFKNFIWKFMFRANLNISGLIKHLQNRNQTTN